MTSPAYIGDSVFEFFASPTSGSRRNSYIITQMSPTNGQKVKVEGERRRKYNWRAKAEEVISDVDLTDKTILITGTTSGLGKETAKVLALRGAHIVMANRNLIESKKVKQEILDKNSDAKIDILSCDLSSLQSVQSAAKEFKEKHCPLHVLVLNAGVFAPTQKMTIDGLETSFQVNHVANQYLVRELLPVLRLTQNSRIVVISSVSHAHTGLKASMALEEKVKTLCPVEGSDYSYRLYAYSKMCNVLMAFKLHRDEEQNNVATYVLHPGSLINTGLSRSWGLMGRLVTSLALPFTKSISQAAATTAYCAASPDVAEISGKFWDSCWDDEKLLHHEIAKDEDLQDAIWQKTEEIIDKFENSKQPIPAVSTHL